VTSARTHTHTHTHTHNTRPHRRKYNELQAARLFRFTISRRTSHGGECIRIPRVRIVKTDVNRRTLRGPDCGGHQSARNSAGRRSIYNGIFSCVHLVSPSSASSANVAAAADSRILRAERALHDAGLLVPRRGSVLLKCRLALITRRLCTRGRLLPPGARRTHQFIHFYINPPFYLHASQRLLLHRPNAAERILPKKHPSLSFSLSLSLSLSLFLSLALSLSLSRASSRHFHTLARHPAASLATRTGELARADHMWTDTVRGPLDVLLLCCRRTGGGCLVLCVVPRWLFGTSGSANRSFSQKSLSPHCR